MQHSTQKKPDILTTTVGSYPIPDWLSVMPTEQALIDATRVVVDIQRQHGIDNPRMANSTVLMSIIPIPTG